MHHFRGCHPTVTLQLAVSWIRKHAGGYSDVTSQRWTRNTWLNAAICDNILSATQKYVTAGKDTAHFLDCFRTTLSSTACRNTTAAITSRP